MNPAYLAEEFYKLDFNSKTQLKEFINKLEENLKKDLETNLGIRGTELGEEFFEAVYQDFDIKRGVIIQVIIVIKNRIKESNN